MEADTAVTEALADKYEILTQGEAATSDTQGWKTTQLLFSLGAVCLDRYQEDIVVKIYGSICLINSTIV